MSSDGSVAREEHPLLHPEEEDPSVQRGKSGYPASADSSHKTGVTNEEPVEVRRCTEGNGLTAVLILAVASAVLGSSTQFGYNSGVINSSKQAIIMSFNGRLSNNSIIEGPFTSFEMDVAVAIYAVGGMFGALPAGYLADLIGRKYTILLNNIVIWVGVALESCAVHPVMFIVGRFVVGLNSGMNTVLVPLYISEISPLGLRGAMGVMHQMAITSTILLSNVLGLHEVLARPDNQFYGWRILFAFALVFSIFQLATLPWCPRSPKFLFLKRRNEAAARRALVRLRGGSDFEEEIKEMESELEELKKPRERVTLLQYITRPSLRRPFLISIVLHLSQQLSGIVGVLYYSTQIFAAAGVSNGDIATVVVGVVLVAFTIILVFLIEKLGRRTLMLYGLGGVAIFFTLFTSCFCFQVAFYGSNTSSAVVTAPGVLLVISSLGITALFSLGPGAIPWLMVAELFLQEARPVAVTIATIVNWLSNFAVALAFPEILRYTTPYGTAIFIVTCVVFWAYLYVYLPETKGRTVEDITDEFKRKTGETIADAKPSPPE